MEFRHGSVRAQLWFCHIGGLAPLHPGRRGGRGGDRLGDHRYGPDAGARRRRRAGAGGPGDKAIEAGAFWSQLLASLLFIALLLAVAPAISQVYGEPALKLVLQALVLNILLTCFLVVPAARLANQFRFRAQGLIAFGSTVAGGLAALPLALAGHGIDALIVQRLVGGGFFAVLVCWAARWTPPMPPSLAVLRAAFRFSLPLMHAALVDYFSITGYVMLIGLRMPAAAVGQFRIAQRLIEVLQEIAFAPARKVFLPVFVAVRMDWGRRFEMTKTMLDALSVFIFFAAAVAGAAARPIVLLMFGPLWLVAVPVFSIITLMAPVTAFYGVINPLLTAAGKPRLVSHFALANVAIILVAVWFAAPFGLTTLAWGLAGAGIALDTTLHSGTENWPETAGAAASAVIAAAIRGPSGGARARLHLSGKPARHRSVRSAMGRRRRCRAGIYRTAARRTPADTDDDRTTAQSAAGPPTGRNACFVGLAFLSCWRRSLLVQWRHDAMPEDCGAFCADEAAGSAGPGGSDFPPFRTVLSCRIHGGIPAGCIGDPPQRG
jgi:hypothetical protein